jgi:hypothetical protein
LKQRHHQVFLLAKLRSIELLRVLHVISFLIIIFQLLFIALATTTTAGKEPSSKKLRALEAVTNTLLEKVDLPNPITEGVVREALFEPDRFSSNEVEAVVRLLNLLRPYTPKKSESGPNPYPKSVLVCGPFVYIANAILRACGYKDFSRRLCPVYSVGHRHSVPLSASSIYEVFGGRMADRFDIRGPNNRLITSTVVSTMSLAHRNCMFSSFFDIRVIDDICRQHGLVFAQRYANI